MSQYGERIVNTYTNAYPYHELWEVYGSYSHAKINAHEYCLNLFRKYDGEGFKIVSWNTFKFSVAFLAEAVNKKTGEVVNGLVYITADNDRFIDFDNNFKVCPLYDFAPV